MVVQQDLGFPSASNHRGGPFPSRLTPAPTVIPNAAIHLCGPAPRHTAPHFDGAGPRAQLASGATTFACPAAPVARMEHEAAPRLPDRRGGRAVGRVAGGNLELLEQGAKRSRRACGRCRAHRALSYGRTARSPPLDAVGQAGIATICRTEKRVVHARVWAAAPSRASLETVHARPMGRPRILRGGPFKTFQSRPLPRAPGPLHPDGTQPTTSREYLREEGRAVRGPGAFTPTCSARTCRRSSKGHDLKARASTIAGIRSITPS